MSCMSNFLHCYFKLIEINTIFVIDIVYNLKGTIAILMFNNDLPRKL